MTTQELMIDAVRRMRDAQKCYSRTESAALYSAKRNAEKEVDEILAALDAVEWRRRNPSLIDN